MPKPIVEVLQGGSAADSRAALRELYSKYGGSVFGRCSYLLKDRSKAEDAMQDVFAKALTHLAEFRSEASPLTWLMKIATHHCLNLLRAERAPWHQRFRRQEQARSEGHGGPQLSRTARRCASCCRAATSRPRPPRFTTTSTR